MAYAYAGDESLDYLPCHYGRSKLLFRGPRRDLELPYAAALGGTETYGKFIPDPWPALVEAETGLRMVNLGCVNAGADVYLCDPDVIDVASGARLVVLQAMGAANLTNRFYAVHPRRNDRFLRASPALHALFPEVDFTNFHFTRHLVRTLQKVSARRFEEVADELRAVWAIRMRTLVERVRVPVVLLWMADHAPARHSQTDLASEPLLVDSAMLSVLREVCSSYVEVHLDSGPAAGGTEGMVFAPPERPAVVGLPGPADHARVASALAEMLDRFV